MKTVKIKKKDAALSRLIAHVLWRMPEAAETLGDAIEVVEGADAPPPSSSTPSSDDDPPA